MKSTAYSDTQYDMNYPPGIEYHWWNIARSRFILEVLRSECGGDGVFLEVGCGKGVEVKALREAGIETRGVELAEIAPLEEIQAYVQAGTDAIDLPEAQRAQVTGILLLDVIEHLPDPEAFLRSLVPGFPNLSLVVVTVPARQELWSNYDVYYGHFRRYSLDMLESLGAAMNWRQGRVGYFFQMLYLPARLLTALGFDRQTEFRPPGEGSRWLHRLVAGINSWCSRLLSPRVRGSSAYAVFRV